MTHIVVADTRSLSELQGTELASFVRRSLALAIDVVLLGTLFLFGGAALAPLLVRTGLIAQDAKIIFSPGLNWYSVACTVVYFGILTFAGKGKTPGKYFLGIRVVSLTHSRVTFWQSVERALGYGASLLEGGFGFFQYFLHTNNQTVHDRIAETIVVRETRSKLAKS